MTAPSIAAEEYLAAYAQRSGISALQLLEAGRVVASCTCGYEDCEGWQIIPKDCLQPEDTVSITAEDYANPEPHRVNDESRCEHCGRYRGRLECTKGCGGKR